MMIALWIGLGFIGGIVFLIALAWFTRDIFPILFVPSDWDSVASSSWAPHSYLVPLLPLASGLGLGVIGLSVVAAMSYTPPRIERPMVRSITPDQLPELVWPERERPPLPRERPWPDPVLQARALLKQIAVPGGTMAFLGKDRAIDAMHPEYVLRAARIAKRARAEGIQANCSSAHRPYGLGVGGFKNKRNSLHAFGIACDWSGIGRPGSKTAKRFYTIAHEEGLCNPYGPNHGAEWNHFQLGCTKMVPTKHPIQKTINAQGPIDVKKMWGIIPALIGAVKDTAELGLSSARTMVAMNAPPAKTSAKAKTKVRTAKLKKKKPAKTRVAQRRQQQQPPPWEWDHRRDRS